MFNNINNSNNNSGTNNHHGNTHYKSFHHGVDKYESCNQRSYNNSRSSLCQRASMPPRRNQKTSHTHIRRIKSRQRQHPYKFGSQIYLDTSSKRSINRSSGGGFGIGPLKEESSMEKKSSLGGAPSMGIVKDQFSIYSSFIAGDSYSKKKKKLLRS